MLTGTFKINGLIRTFVNAGPINFMQISDHRTVRLNHIVIHRGLPRLEGAHIRIQLPLSALQVIEFDKKLNKWQLLMTSLLKTSIRSTAG